MYRHTLPKGARLFPPLVAAATFVSLQFSHPFTSYRSPLSLPFVISLRALVFSSHHSLSSSGEKLLTSLAVAGRTPHELGLFFLPGLSHKSKTFDPVHRLPLFVSPPLCFGVD